jgi:protein CpxP
MKKLFLMCAFVMGVSAMGFAQGRPPRTPEQQLTQVKTMIAPLTLTDDQVAKLTVVYTVSSKSMDSLRTAVPDRATRQPAQAALMTATNAKIMAILTADQAAALKKARDARRAQRQGGGN